MSDLRRLPIHRVRADERVLVEHHADGSRTIMDERGVPDRYVPASMTMSQWAPLRSGERRRAYVRGYRNGARIAFEAGALLSFVLTFAAAVAVLALVVRQLRH